jgi:hypothetical protein
MTMVYVSYIAPRQRFVAHREGLGQIWAADLKELRAKVTAALRPDAEIRFALSRGARAEVARRRGAPVEVGWT